jgi:hypothetical protein
MSAKTKVSEIQGDEQKLSPRLLSLIPTNAALWGEIPLFENILFIQEAK